MYLDGVYIGIVPIDFEKIIGEFSITIKKKDGSEYTLDLEGSEDAFYGSEDIWYSFP